MLKNKHLYPNSCFKKKSTQKMHDFYLYKPKYSSLQRSKQIATEYISYLTIK